MRTQDEENGARIADRLECGDTVIVDGIEHVCVEPSGHDGLHADDTVRWSA